MTSQTIFAQAANFSGKYGQEVSGDPDANGWPQGGRNQALAAIRKSYSCMIAGDQLQQDNKLSVQTCAWYQKSHPTFSDAIAAVRRQIWRSQKFLTSYLEADVNN